MQLQQKQKKKNISIHLTFFHSRCLDELFVLIYLGSEWFRVNGMWISVMGADLH